MMTQGELAFKYKEDKRGAGMTGMAGIGVYLDLACRSGMVRNIEQHVRARKGGQGWTDVETVLSLVMLNLVGGECVEDVDRLESDKGFCRLLKKALSHGLRRKARRVLKKRWRKEKTRSVPSSSSVFRYLAGFHDSDQELLKYCDGEDNKWCGRIEFTVSSDVTPEFKKAVGEIGDEDWVVLMKRERSGKMTETRRQWAEVCFVPNAIGRSKNGPEYRYLAIREPMQDQLMLPGMEQDDREIGFFKDTVA